MTVRKLLDNLGQQLTICRPEDTILLVTSILSTRDIGALPVCDENDNLVGIVSERDIVNAFARSGCRLRGLKVGRVMSTNVISCAPDDSLEKIRTLLRRHRIRHLPVIERGLVLGILSIRDLLDTSLEETRLEFNASKGDAIAASLS